MKRKNGFLTFIFSFIPGAGQMYQCSMKRGLSIMVIYGTCMILSALVFSLSVLFLVPIMIIVAYSFFDTWNIRNLTDEERAKYIDRYIWEEEEFSKLMPHKNKKKILKVVGTILIIAGIIIFFSSFVLRLLNNLEIEWVSQVVRAISRYAPSVMASAIAIVVGIKLVSNKSKEE